MDVVTFFFLSRASLFGFCTFVVAAGKRGQSGGARHRKQRLLHTCFFVSFGPSARLR